MCHQFQKHHRAEPIVRVLVRMMHSAEFIESTFKQKIETAC